MCVADTDADSRKPGAEAAEQEAERRVGGGPQRRADGACDSCALETLTA